MSEIRNNSNKLAEVGMYAVEVCHNEGNTSVTSNM